MEAKNSEIKEPLMGKDEEVEIKLQFEELDHFKVKENGDVCNDVSLAWEEGDLNTKSREQHEIDNDEIGVESLDYEPIQSFVSARTRRVYARRHLYGYFSWLVASSSSPAHLGD
eukprot:Gb_12443 [translate_table: standard]